MHFDFNRLYYILLLLISCLIDQSFQGSAVKIQGELVPSKEDPNYIHVQLSLLCMSQKDNVRQRTFSLYSSEGDLNIKQSRPVF